MAHKCESGRGATRAPAGAEWIEGSNVRTDIRLGADDPDRLEAYVTELVALQPDAVVASGPTPVLALQRETCTVPIICTQVNEIQITRRRASLWLYFESTCDG
jgi:putative tryptophan/tyrosine transport system substrate-binding protein